MWYNYRLLCAQKMQTEWQTVDPDQTAPGPHFAQTWLCENLGSLR